MIEVISLSELRSNSDVFAVILQGVMLFPHTQENCFTVVILSLAITNTAILWTARTGVLLSLPSESLEDAIERLYRNPN